MSKLLFGLSFWLVSSWLFAPRVSASDSLAKQLTGAIERLEEQDSYRWNSKVEDLPETRSRPGPTQGVTESGGMTQVAMPFGPRSLLVVIKGDKAAIIG